MNKLVLLLYLFLKVENVTAFLFRGVPCQERFPIFRIHTIWAVIWRGWNGTDVILIFFLVEKMGKVSFRKFFDSKRFREICQFHRNEIQPIDELNFEHGNLQIQRLGAVHNHIVLHSLFT